MPFYTGGERTQKCHIRLEIKKPERIIRSGVVPKAGLEPAHGRPYRILSPTRLPIPPLRPAKAIIAEQMDAVNKNIGFGKQKEGIHPRLV